MVVATNLGYPRIGPRRELKRALERYWSGKIAASDLLDAAAAIRRDNWATQSAAGLSSVPSNDFSLYDQILDTTAMLGAVPKRYGWSGETVDLTTYFAMARGHQEGDVDLPAMEMTKWFDTNYHYIVPEFYAGQSFQFASTKPVDEFSEAREQGVATRPVLVGPVTYLLLGKSDDEAFDPLTLLDSILPIYAEVLQRLEAAGAEWVQIDEPVLVLDLEPAARDAFARAYESLTAASGLKILLTTYFGDLRENLSTALALPVHGLHVDLVRAPDQLDDILTDIPDGLLLSLGVIDGRNVWKADFRALNDRIATAIDRLGPDRIQIAPSCSLLHTPVDLDLETDFDPDVRQWLAFARQKLDELVVLSRAFAGDTDAVAAELQANRAAAGSRAESDRIHSRTVASRTAAVTESMLHRAAEYEDRRAFQNEHLELPLLPTTTIGSFPQTGDVRSARAAFKRGKSTREEYDAFLRTAIEDSIRWQEEIGLDVLVHGEFERTDMVEYFGQKLNGFAFTKRGWVQSYGSRCVRPPIIYGDVSREDPMTVEWTRYAQSLTDRPVKGMLTGPVTILQWSFVRDDQPESDTCRQIALAIRDEVRDLEWTGIKIIQIDEAALREGLPLRRADWDKYLDWAVACFRLSSSGVSPEIQVHTHMCYSEFNDIIHAITAMDADVISIESSRSKMELLDAFAAYDYPAEIGPGVYDIHSPRVPGEPEMEDLLDLALDVFSSRQLWVNPDCGLKTRTWDEVRPAVERMVSAAQKVRDKLAAAQPSA
ncbi:MAG: 5-methyltetrahydropteroyltriglutamate--homocysteine S-methyltransferase [Chloroflexota bacterium]|nr:5-methyltetrahydropteroyltriglutamate--homocysteine S-methyltransferase [Chloroflexota bacterium]